MKWIACTLLAALLLTGTLICGGVAEDANASGSIHWGRDFTLKYREDPTVNQIIAVQYTGGYSARVLMYVKSVENGKSVWTPKLSCDGVVGRNGIGKTVEGDNKTPVGDFGVITAFGIKENPGTALPYVDVTENTYCCGDALFYNQIIDISEHPHDCANGERMIEFTPEYNVGLFMDYNKACTVGKGSAIFFHCFGAKPYTAGCVAVSEEDMTTILQAVDPGVRIVIDYLDATSNENE